VANLKITDYETAASTFTFPYNPNSVEMATAKNFSQIKIPYFFTIFGFGSPIRSSISIGLNGHFSGSTKNSNYRSLVAKVNNPILTKLYFENSYDKFYLCTGSNVQKVPTGTRPMHIDYVANFLSPFGILFDETQKSGLVNSGLENEGDMPTPIEKITGSVTIATPVTIKDKNDNGFTFTPTKTGTMTYYLVKIVSEDNIIYLTEYMYVEVGGDAQIVKNASTSGDLMLKLDSEESINDIFAAGTVTGITATFYFRDGWSSD